MLKPREVADRLHCSLSNVYALIESGKLPVLCIGASGKGYRVTEGMLTAFLAKQRTERAEEPRKAARQKLKHLRL